MIYVGSIYRCLVVAGGLLGRVEAGRGLDCRGGNSNRGVVRYAGFGIKWSFGWDEMNRNGENEPQRLSWLVFGDTPCRPPNS